MSDEPLYAHECEGCTFLGRCTRSGAWFDLYFCTQGSLPTVISRRSSDPPDYTSGLEIARAIEAEAPADPLVEALRRARARGFCT